MRVQFDSLERDISGEDSLFKPWSPDYQLRCALSELTSARDRDDALAAIRALAKGEADQPCWLYNEFAMFVDRDLSVASIGLGFIDETVCPYMEMPVADLEGLLAAWRAFHLRGTPSYWESQPT